MGKGSANTAAVEVDDVSAMTQGETARQTVKKGTLAPYEGWRWARTSCGTRGSENPFKPAVATRPVRFTRLELNSVYTDRQEIQSHALYLRSGADSGSALFVPAGRRATLGLPGHEAAEVKRQLGGKNPPLQDSLCVAVDCCARGVAGRGFRLLFTISPAPDEASWLFEHAWIRYFVSGVLVIYMALILLPVAVAIWKNVTKTPRKYSSADAMKSLSYFLPATWTERRCYAFLCITAGICEDVLFRGFLQHYLHARHDMAKLKGTAVEKILAKAGGVFGDKGFIGTDYITTPIRKPECRELLQWEHEWNNRVSSFRAPVERAVATLKTWRILFTDYRRPLKTFNSSFYAAIGLYFFKETFA